MSEFKSIDNIVGLIKDVPNFPKEGVTFKDITPILETPKAFQALIQHFIDSIDFKVDKILAIESRGFILGAPLAQALGVGMVLVRKPGKLPRKTFSVSYDLEYGSDTLEMHEDAVTAGDRVLVVDDVLATGGTAAAVEQLVEKAGAELVGHRFLMEIDFLKGIEKLKADVKSLLNV